MGNNGEISYMLHYKSFSALVFLNYSPIETRMDLKRQWMGSFGRLAPESLHSTCHTTENLALGAVTALYYAYFSVAERQEFW